MAQLKTKYKIAKDKESSDIIANALEDMNTLIVAHIEKIKELGISNNATDIASSLFATYISGIQDARTFMWYLLEKFIITETLQIDETKH